MSVPQSFIFQLDAISSCTNDIFPHVSAWINSWDLASSSDSFYKIHDELAIVCIWVASPWAAWWWVSFYINPYLTVVFSRHSVDKFIDLCISIFTSAWEHVNIHVFEASSSGISNIGSSIRIKGAIRFVGSWNSELHSVVPHALPCGSREYSGDINTLGGESSRYCKWSENDRWKAFHYYKLYNAVEDFYLYWGYQINLN